jgi:hypothetical protein
MQALTLLCALAAAGIGGEQFYTGGLRAFLDRPPGVGATPPTPPATGPAATASAGNPATAAH